MSMEVNTYRYEAAVPDTGEARQIPPIVPALTAPLERNETTLEHQTVQMILETIVLDTRSS